MTVANNEDPNIFLDYLSTLPTEFCNYLYNRPSAALFIFRLLPTVSQQILVKLIWNTNVTESLMHKEESLQSDSSVRLLLSLHLALHSNGALSINTDFRRSYLKGVMLGAQRCAQLRSANVEEKKRTRDIGKKSAERWECILRYLALPSDQNISSVSSTTRRLFLNAGFTTGDEGNIEITSAGFQFLLLSPVQQMWTYMREYLKLEEADGHDIRDQLDLLIRIILCIDRGDDPSKRSYELDDEWSPRQVELVNHLRELGLIFIRKRKDGVLFLTPLLWNLSMGSDFDAGNRERKTGNIIVETNFRVYAYTSSSLQLAIISTFTEMTYRFNDMTVGSMTRESVRRALQVGITASQIISFLRANAHPQCIASGGSLNCLPVTVADQIRLWEDERKRLTLTDVAYYTQFESEQEFIGVRDFALGEGILQWADNTQHLIIVTEEGHSKVKQWWRQNRSQQ